MNSSREQILADLKQSTGSVSEQSNINLDKIFMTLCKHPAAPVQPELYNGIVETFIQEARAKSAEVHLLSSLNDLPDWVSQKSKSLQQTPQLSLSPELAHIFKKLAPFETSSKIKQENSWGICRGKIGIAETGTIVSNSQACASGMLFLVERLIVIINKADIVAYQEDAWLKLRNEFPDRQPRTINLITGPSRTADVEQHIQLGAHGPRWADYIVVG